MIAAHDSEPAEHVTGIVDHECEISRHGRRLAFHPHFRSELVERMSEISGHDWWLAAHGSAPVDRECAMSCREMLLGVQDCRCCLYCFDCPYIALNYCQLIRLLIYENK